MIVATILIVISILLVWAIRIGDAPEQLLLGVAISLFVWALLGSKESTKLSEFLVKSFIISFVVTVIVWFATLAFMGPEYIAFISAYGLWSNILVYVLLPRSLLPVAMSAIIFGIFRTKLRFWEILLSSWYVFVFVVQAAYIVWWTLFVQPYITNYYQGGGGPIALDLLLLFIAFLAALVTSTLYSALKKSTKQLLNHMNAKLASKVASTQK